VPSFDIAGSQMVGAAIGRLQKGALATVASLAASPPILRCGPRELRRRRYRRTAHDIVVTVAMPARSAATSR
jgi:hypothetical protein